MFYLLSLVSTGIPANPNTASISSLYSNYFNYLYYSQNAS
jgi:hypothetical protein